MGASINTHCLMVSKMDGMLTATPRLLQTVFTSERIAKKQYAYMAYCAVWYIIIGILFFVLVINLSLMIYRRLIVNKVTAKVAKKIIILFLPYLFLYGGPTDTVDTSVSTSVVIASQ